MAILPDYMRLTPAEQAGLDEIKRVAKIRHEKERKAAKRNGRHHFPDQPFECSWAYETGYTSRAIRARSK